MTTDPSPAENPIDLPTGEPIPGGAPSSSSASTPSPSPTKATTHHLFALLRSLPKSTDAFLTHLQRCLATPQGVDTTLLFICYTSRLSGALLATLSRSLLLHSSNKSARDLVALLFTLPPKTTIVFSPAAGAGAATSSKPAQTAAAQLAALLAARLKSLGGLASEARTIARLWGLLGMYFWAKRLTSQLFSKPSSPNESSSRLTTLISWAQLLSCTAFQYLENGAYLSGKGVLGWTPKEQGRAYVVGARFLGVHTALELGKLLAQIVVANNNNKRPAAAVAGDEKSGEVQTSEEKAQAEAVRRSMAINLAWTPLTLHWSTEGGFLSEAAVGLGGCIPGVIQMSKLWRETAQ